MAGPDQCLRPTHGGACHERAHVSESAPRLYANHAVGVILKHQIRSHRWQELPRDVRPGPRRTRLAPLRTPVGLHDCPRSRRRRPM